MPHTVASYSDVQTESYGKVTRGQVHEPTKLELEAARQAGTISKIDLANFFYGYVIIFFFNDRHAELNSECDGVSASR